MCIVCCPQDQLPADADSRRKWPWFKALKWVLHNTYRLFNRCALGHMQAVLGWCTLQTSQPWIDVLTHVLGAGWCWGCSWPCLCWKHCVQV
jgi:hypothetical protein